MKLIYLLITGFLLFSPLLLEAVTQPLPDSQGPTQPLPSSSGGYTLPNPTGLTSFTQLIDKVADLAIKVGLPIAAVFIIYSGFLFVSALGNQEKITRAKSAFWWAVIGALVIVAAKAITAALSNFAGKLN
ncbi:hypothetical protein HYW53_03780 [Candidatus Giovannonibacteria bacterium]|nr:hypothetical protein [Candidatus Giovannonibacteria bacterium]